MSSSSPHRPPQPSGPGELGWPGSVGQRAGLGWPGDLTPAESGPPRRQQAG